MSLSFNLPRLKACEGCVVAKARCEPGADYTKCHRCTRLNVECIVKEALSRKRRRIHSEHADVETAYSLEELTCGIQHYQSSLSQYFPFVVIPKNAQASGFSKKQPFLSLVLAMLGSTQDRQRQCALAAQCRQYLGTHVLQKGEKSLDLLQGLLLLVHWHHIQKGVPGDRTCMLLHVVMAMVVDLELNKSPFAKTRLRMAREVVRCPGSNLAAPTDHPLEAKRAFVGCVFLVSVKSKSSTEMDATNFSEYVQECCNDLGTSGLPSDKQLVAMVRLQHIVERFEHAKTFLSPVEQTNGLGSDFMYPTSCLNGGINVQMFVKHWELELAHYWDTVSPGAKTMLLQIQYFYAQNCLYEIGLDETLFSEKADRVQILRGSLAAVTSFYAAFLLPLLQPQQEQLLLYLPTHCFAQSSRITFVAMQLRSVRCEGWARNLVEQELQLAETLDRSAEILARLLGSHPREQIPEYFLRLDAVGKTLRLHCRATEIPDESESAEKEGDLSGFSDGELGLDFLGQFLDFDNNMWLQNLLTV